MRKTTLAFICFLMSSFAPLLSAQCFTYNDNYAMYWSVSFDSTYIYTSVTVDGTGNMTFISGNGCGSINYGSAQHIPGAINVIAVQGTNTYVGGQLNGSGGCPTCYISATNNQQMAWDSSHTYTLNAEGVVGCTFGGSIFSTDEPQISMIPAATVGKKLSCTASTDESGKINVGLYNPSCSIGNPQCPITTLNGVPTWSLIFAGNETCWGYARTAFMAIYEDGTINECLKAPLSLPTDGPGLCF